MILLDVNVLLNAHREEQEHHQTARRLVEAVADDVRPHAISELVLSSFVRVATHRRALDPPTELEVAFGFCGDLLERPNARVVAPGPRHWDIFADLCRRTDAVSGLVPDAYLAALAIDSGAELLSFDRDFARFVSAGLRWRSPVDD